MRRIWTTLVVLLAISLAGVSAANAEDKGPLSLGITGSTPSEPTRNPTAILRPPEVQRLILAIAERPHSRAEIETVLAGQFFTVDDMVAVGLLREEAGDFWIDFNLLRVADQLRILEVEKKTVAQMLAAYEQDVTADVARVMMELGREALDAGALGERTGLEERKLGRILAFLEAAEYVEPHGEAWQATVLVLRGEDAAKVDAMVALGRKIMLEWHEANYDRVRETLADLTPIRNGVPFERVYTEIWHFLFGFANRTLVEEGLFADPYGEERRYPGFLPIVWDSGLAQAP